MKVQKFFIISICIVWITGIFAGEVNASVHELESLDIHVSLEEDGSAIISEKRVATLSEGTENFIVIGNLGESTITDFSVYENGKPYDFVENWDPNWTREEKAFKNGFIKKDDHYELVWGIGEYGKHEYELTYTVTDFIKQLEDSQMLFWQFVNSDTNIPPQHVKVTIETDQPLTEDSERIWAFGYDGDIRFEDGKIVAESDSPLTESDYVTILTELPNSNFRTDDVIDQPFEEIKEQAFEGSDYTSGNWITGTLIPIIALIFIIGFLPALVMIDDKRRRKKRIRKYEGKYMREAPYNGNPFMAYGSLHMFQLSDLNNLLSAFILKWIKDERIHVVPVLKKGIFRDQEIAEFHLPENGADGLEKSEKELFHFFVRASTDRVLQPKDFKKWSKKNYKLVSEWEVELIDEAQATFEEEGFLELKEEDMLGEIHQLNIVTAKTEEFKDNVYKFKNYLNDFSLLNERGPVNVKVWDELMIWAALLGLTEVVYKEFKELYPKYEQQSIYTYASISTASAYARRMNHAVTSSGISGAGGTASFGGGGGSFGGGSGGGTR